MLPTDSQSFVYAVVGLWLVYFSVILLIAGKLAKGCVGPFFHDFTAWEPAPECNSEWRQCRRCPRFETRNSF